MRRATGVASTAPWVAGLRELLESSMALAPVSLDDKYALENGRALMSGTQALVRLPMLQREADLVSHGGRKAVLMSVKI